MDIIRIACRRTLIEKVYMAKLAVFRLNPANLTMHWLALACVDKSRVCESEAVEALPGVEVSKDAEQGLEVSWRRTP